MNLCIFGGQYGSEGKASAVEYWAKRIGQFVAFSEPGPNAGHTCSMGVTSCLPAAAFFSIATYLGPDTVIDKSKLFDDWEKTGRRPLFIHEHAAVCTAAHREQEKELRKRIASTATGTGAARADKYFQRNKKAVAKNHKWPAQISIINTEQWLNQVADYKLPFVFECSQGVLLDTNIGHYPYVTSRCTLPRVAIERSLLGERSWIYVGVYRTYPIRVGGLSGPTGREQISWASLKQKPELTSVTKTQRRLFPFSLGDFALSVRVSRPDILMFTHADYLNHPFPLWFERTIGPTRLPTYYSTSPSNFVAL